MPLNFRHFKQIVSTWTSYVVGHSAITDLNPGSITRTLGEAFALELAQGYIQIQNLLNLFSIDKASGDDLDERGLDFALPRLQPQKSVGTVTIGDVNLTAANTATTTTSAATAVAATSLTVVSTTGFPTSGTIIIDRGVPSLREKLPYSARTSTTLTLASPATFAHLSGATVQLSTVGSDRTIAQGTALSTGGINPLRFSTTQAAVLYDGDYQVTSVPVSSLGAGSALNVAAGSITVFASPPFPTAWVMNPSPLLGGADLEADEAYRTRLKASQQNLSSSTASRIQSEALSVVLPTTGQQVVSAKLVEPVAPGASILYISDGTTGFVASQSNVSTTEVVVGTAKVGQTRAALANWPLVQGTESLYVSIDRGVATATSASTVTDTTRSWGVNAYAGFLVKDIAGAIYTVVSNTATALTVSGTATPAFGPYAIVNPGTAAYPGGSKLTSGTDYTINDTNGQLQLTATSFPGGLHANDTLLALVVGNAPAYIYYTGLLQLVQRTINGDPTDLANFPGVKAAGTQVQVQVPTLAEISIQGVIVAEMGVDESTLRLPVQQAIVAYVNGLGIADNVLVSRIVQAAVGVPGVFDFQLQTPMGNIVIADNEIAKVSLSDVKVN